MTELSSRPAMRPEHIELLLQPGSPAIAPDGSAVVVAVGRPHLGADAEVGQLWRIALPDGEPTRITRGFHDAAPSFSPDGGRIAFLRSTRTAPPQLVVIPVAGGEPVTVTDRDLGVGSFAWSPDGQRIAFVSREPEPGRYGTVDGLGADAEPPRRFTELRYLSNGTGVITDRPARLFVVDVPAVDAEPGYEPAPRTGDEPKPATVPAPTRLETGDGDVGAPEFSADGRSVLVIGALHETRDTDLVSDLWRIPVDGGAPERLTDGTSDVETFAVDGDRVWTVGSDLGESCSDFVGRGGALTLWRDGEPTRLTDPATTDLGDGPSPTVVGAAAGGGAVLVVRRARGAADLVRVDAAGAAAVLTEGVDVLGHAAAGGRIVVSVQTPGSAGEVALIDHGLHLLTRFGAELQSVGLAVPHELVVTARDGAEVQGWVTVPAGEGPHPVLLMIHGGPFAQYGAHLFDETQVLVTAGYAVVQCNPRGAAGYGEAHAQAIRHRMGTVDLTDVLDFLDGAIAATPGLDAARVGIMGGSYGGYLTAWTIAHDHRFAAAIVERGFLDPDGFIGTSDIGTFFGDEYLGTDPALVASQSPQAVALQVRTPTLVIHSEQDLRCPLPQGQRYYATLKRNGVETELLVFPGEDHELSRSGRPRHRVQRFEAILDWWQRHLPVTSA